MAQPKYIGERPLPATSTMSATLLYLRELRRKYRYLYLEKVRTLEDGSVGFHHARLFRREGINVLHCKGDEFEMAFQHGRLLRKEVNEGVLHQLSRTIPNLLYNTVSRNPFLNKVLIAMLDFLGTNVLKQHIPTESLRETYALSEGSGMNLGKMSDALLCMEALYILAKYAVKSKVVETTPLAFGGCSSMVAWNDYTEEGRMIFGRNLDYPLNGYFDAHPLVTYYEPEFGQKYVSLGTAGLATPGLTAFNESGIYLAAHLIPTEETSFQGTPVHFVAADVLRNATTFDEAVERFHQYRNTIGWAFVLISAKERRVASVELTNERIAIRESTRGLHVQTNHFSILESANLHVNRSVDLDTLGRFSRLEDIAREHLGGVNAPVVAAAMGDQWDPFEKKLRGLGSTVGVHITVGSAIFHPETGEFSVAAGHAPTPHNAFVEMPSIEDFSPDTFSTKPYEKLQAANPALGDASFVSAIQHYIRAKCLFEYENDILGAFEAMERVIRLDAGNAAYQFVHGIFALKLHDFGGAAATFSHVLEMDHTDQLHNLARYYRGRIHAHEGRTEEAVADFEGVLGSGAHKKLKQAAQKSLNLTRLFGHHALRPEKLQLMMQFADMVTY